MEAEEVAPASFAGTSSARNQVARARQLRSYDFIRLKSIIRALQRGKNEQVRLSSTAYLLPAATLVPRPHDRSTLKER
jgi:hypothetical protein